jgi:hypothetical protein
MKKKEGVVTCVAPKIVVPQETLRFPALSRLS